MKIYLIVMIVSIAHWDICNMKILLSILMAIVMYLHFSMQEENIIEHTNAKYHWCAL